MFLKRGAAMVLLIARARAIDTSGLPSCGSTCVNNANSQQTECSQTDLSCLCGDKQLAYNIGTCLGLTCDTIDQETSIQWLENMCDHSSGGTATQTTALFTAIATGSTATATSTAGSAGSSSNNGDQKSSGGLSLAAKVGIGVGVPLGVLLLAGGIILAYWLGKRKKDTPTGQISSAQQPSTAEINPRPPATYTSVPIDAKFAPPPAVTEIYPQPQTPPPMIQQPNAYQEPGTISPLQPTMLQPPLYEAAGVPRQYDMPGVAPQGSPPRSMVYKVPTNAPTVTGNAELPAGQC